MTLVHDISAHPLALAFAVLVIGATLVLFGRWFFVALGLGESTDDSGRRRRRDQQPFVSDELKSATLEKRIKAARREMKTHTRPDRAESTTDEGAEESARTKEEVPA
jgi:hypothetical protein